MAMNDESRLISMRILQNFVRETKGKWNHDQWLKLVQRVRRAGFEKVEESRLGQLIEENRDRWIAGDNSVVAPAAAKKEEPKPEAKKEEPKPEVKKEEPKPEVKKEEPKPEIKKEEPKPEIKKEEPKPEVKKEEPKPEARKEEPRKPAQHSASAEASLNPQDEKQDLSVTQEKHQRRLAVMKRSQDLTRELAELELEIRRLENVHDGLRDKFHDLDNNRKSLEDQRKHFQKDVDEVSSEVGKLRANVEALTNKRSELEDAVGQKKRQRAEHVAAIAHSKSEKESLIA